PGAYRSTHSRISDKSDQRKRCTVNEGWKCFGNKHCTYNLQCSCSHGSRCFDNAIRDFEQAVFDKLCNKRGGTNAEWYDSGVHANRRSYYSTRERYRPDDKDNDRNSSEYVHKKSNRII